MDFNVFLFEDFETLDAFGPVEVVGYLPDFNIKFYSIEGGVVFSRHDLPVIILPIAEADQSGIILIPGGIGMKNILVDKSKIEKITQIVQKSSFCLTVCTGSAILAQTGLLEAKKATSNKRLFNTVKSLNNKVDWVAKARWVVDGKYYTASGVSAGIDMALGFIADYFSVEKAKEIATYIEYSWHETSTDDPFSTDLSEP